MWRIPGETYYGADGRPFVEPEPPASDQAVNDARQQPAPLEYRQMWVGEYQTEQLAPLCTRAAQDGWSLHSVTFGKNSWLPPGNGPERLGGGWLVLFFRHRMA
jgi:hypothetical protein